jgi:hypothetical protein
MRVLLLLLLMTACKKHDVPDKPMPTAMSVFIFIGYDMTDPTAWAYVRYNGPDCNYSSGQVCYITCKKELYSDYPTQDALTALAQKSSNFTTPYWGIEGSVRLKP